MIIIMAVFQTVLTILLGFFKDATVEEAGLCGNGSKRSDIGVPDAFQSGFTSTPSDNL
jgi:hypothetical protein